MFTFTRRAGDIAILWHLLCRQKHEAVIPADYCMMLAVLDESMLLECSRAHAVCRIDVKVLQAEHAPESLL